MRCNKCNTNNLDAIHGRIFCADCGYRAADRLSRFSTPRASSASNVLDLSHYSQAEQENLISDSSTPQSTSPNRGDPAPLNSRPFAGDIGSIPAAATSSEPQPEPTANTFTNQPVASPNAPMTMQPSQTYSLKPDAQNPQQGAAALVASETEEENHELPLVSEEEIAATKTSAPDQKRRWRLPWMSNARAWRMAAVSLCIILLGSYITYLNYPDLAVRVAASRADVQASLPDYTPQGYRFSGPVAYDSGALTITFTDNTREEIAITQAATDWNSDQLLNNHIRYEASRYTTYEDDGVTIYTYNDSQAAWVEDGVLYEIDGTQRLDEEEIVKIAGSL